VAQNVGTQRHRESTPCPRGRAPASSRREGGHRADPFSRTLLGQYETLYPGDAKFTAGSACSGLYRGLKLWEAAVKKAGSLNQDDVIKALEYAKIAEGPGGPAEMVPDQHHVRMNMYIAQAINGQFKVVKDLGTIDPKERNVPGAVEMSRMRASS
jgi:hypothetical protein